jgi:hypothetical protein
MFVGILGKFFVTGWDGELILATAGAGVKNSPRRARTHVSVAMGRWRRRAGARRLLSEASEATRLHFGRVAGTGQPGSTL